MCSDMVCVSLLRLVVLFGAVFGLYILFVALGVRIMIEFLAACCYSDLYMFSCPCFFPYFGYPDDAFTKNKDV